MEPNEQETAKPLGEILAQALPMDLIQPALSARASENFDHVALSPEETAEALRSAREKKHYRLQEQEREERAAEIRRLLTERWSYEKTRTWIEGRIDEVFPGEKIVFQDVQRPNGEFVTNAGSLFTLLCLYFSMDPAFVVMADELGVKNPDLRKGLLIAGRIGGGKTTLMRLFQRNQRQVYMMQSAKDIAWNWRQADKDAGLYMEKLTNLHKLPVNDIQNFYHRFAGLCVDDAGTEDVQISFGNRASVIGDIIEGRYFNRCMGPMFHMTTNLTMADIKDYYGERVGSRLRETMNVIQYIGEDRRK